MHHKTDKEVRGQTDESRQRSVRQRKRMLKFMKVVTFILQALLIPVIPEVVAGFRGLSSPNRVTDSGLFSNSNSAVNPIIYYTDQYERTVHVYRSENNVNYQSWIRVITCKCTSHKLCEMVELAYLSLAIVISFSV